MGIGTIVHGHICKYNYIVYGFSGKRRKVPASKRKCTWC